MDLEISIVVMVFSKSLICCEIKTILEKMGLQGKVTPLQAKKKLNNLKNKDRKYVVIKKIIFKNTI